MYKCIVCDKSFKSNRTLKNHLKSDGHAFRTKNPQILFSCACGKSFQYKQGLSRHKQECGVMQKEKISKKSDTNEITKLREENKKLQQKLDAIMLEPKVINNTTTTTNSNNKTQNNVTIQINAVGYENLDHITDQIIIESVGKVFSSIPNILKHIHYDPEHPENLNIQIPNKKQPYARIFKKKSGKWETVHRDEAIDDMVDRGYGFLDDNYPNVKDQISEYNQKHFKRFQDNFEADPNVKKIIKKDVDMMVMNATRD